MNSTPVPSVQSSAFLSQGSDQMICGTSYSALHLVLLAEPKNTEDRVTGH